MQRVTKGIIKRSTTASKKLIKKSAAKRVQGILALYNNRNAEPSQKKALRPRTESSRSSGSEFVSVILDSDNSHQSSVRDGDIPNVIPSSIDQMINSASTSHDQAVSTESSNFSSQLAKWSVEENISLSALGKLLKLLRSNFPLSQLKNLPKDPRTLLQTPINTNIKQMGSNGCYYYFGIQESVTDLFNKITIKLSLSDEISLAVNIDGVPLFKSTNESFWPILCTIKSVKLLEKLVFCVGLYKGSGKPEANDLLKDFVNECIHLYQNGVIVNSQIHKFNISMIICDAPAKAYILYVKSHSAYFSCTKCSLEGDFCCNTLCFQDLVFRKRSNESFRNKEQPEHHTGNTVLENLPNFNMINNIPIDYMHCILLGVVKRLLCNKKFGWVFGKPPNKLRASDIYSISNQCLLLKKFIPCEFARKPRSLVESKRFKASEFRLLLLYTGPIVFKNVLSSESYNNFICLSVATLILASNELYNIESYFEYAHKLFEHFISNSIRIYGSHFISYNVHNLLHLNDCVKLFGPLDSFSAFPFENYMRQITRKVRKTSKPLQQVVRRTYEERNIYASKLDLNEHRKFMIEHDSGPLLVNCHSPQFKVLVTEKYRLNVAKICDRFVELDNGTIIEIKNFATNQGNIVVIGLVYTRKGDFFKKPCPSSLFGISFIKKVNNELNMFKASMIKKKIMILPFKNEFISFPLLHM